MINLVFIELVEGSHNLLVNYPLQSSKYNENEKRIEMKKRCPNLCLLVVVAYVPFK